MERRIAVGESPRMVRRRVVVVSLAVGLLIIFLPVLNHERISNMDESMLRDDLFTLRSLIQQYTLDKGKAPQSLDDLVNAGYLKQIPIDPFTKSWTTWVTEPETKPLDLDAPGIVGVHSGSDLTESDGTPYSNW